VNTAVVIVDVQNDFCAGGAIAVADSDGIIPTVNALMRAFRRVFLTQDWHPPGHVSFASSHPGAAAFRRVKLPEGEQELWPDHCVAGTHGADLHAALEIPGDATIIRKGVRKDIDSYSAFFENDRQTPVGLDARLRADGVGEVVVAGLATDYCVLHTALDARALGYDVTVVESGCRGVDLEGSLAAAWGRMTKAGVRRG
jgi:nicotinamidase-related amidase